MSRSLDKPRRALAAAGVALAVLAPPASAQTARVPKLKELTLDELASIEVTSVSRRGEPLDGAPASIVVVTGEDIRRSGATSLAEALRLAPNLQVARIDAARYAVSARGFNNAVANKLLVLVDGRTIYTPLFSGVFWDQQDVLLEDVERIEIISGPGATLWGANAANGVINVITRRASETQGTLVSAGGGTREQTVTARFGDAIGSRGHFRAYTKGTRLENTETSAGAAVMDGRRWFQAGFRADFGGKDDGLTVQGDVYDGRSEDRGTVVGFELGRVELSGMNVLARLVRPTGDRSSLRIRAYFDHYRREERVLFQPEADLFDLEIQHGIAFTGHRVQWGAGYRHGRDEVQDGILVGFRPTGRTLTWQHVFAQDEVRLGEKLDVSGGIKLERNDYSGWEYLPSGRAAWKAAEDHLVWGAVSRAVRAPARLDREVIDGFGTVLGGPDFQSEVANVVELGYRGRPFETLTSSVTGFLHRWNRLRSGTAVPVILENRIEGPVYGIEGWATWQPIGAWRLSGGATAFRKRLRLEPGSTDPVGTRNPQLANDPPYQWMLRSSYTLAGRHEVDVLARHVAALPNPRVPAYTTGDVRYAFRVRPDLELSVTGQDVFDGAHPEFGGAPGRSEVTRGVFVQARWSR